MLGITKDNQAPVDMFIRQAAVARTCISFCTKDSYFQDSLFKKIQLFRKEIFLNPATLLHPGVCFELDLTELALTGLPLTGLALTELAKFSTHFKQATFLI